jgi:Na+-driven multidrug efflux pump
MKLLRDVLRTAGYETLEATTGLRAVERDSQGVSPQVAVTTNTRLGHAAGDRNRDACMSVVRKFVAVGAVLGLALGILVSVTTDVPFAPEAGLLLGALVGWFSHARRDRPVPD